MQFKYVVLLILLVSGMISCADDSLVPDAQVGGREVIISMELSVPERDSVNISTRAIDLTAQVSDFYLFIFDAGSEKLVSKYYFASGETNSVSEYSTNANAVISRNENGEAGTLSNIITSSGERIIMGVANVNMKVGSAILDDLNEVTNVTGLKTALAKEPTVTPSTFTMSGYYSAGTALSDDGKVTISKDGQLDGTIHLVRVDASIKFDVDTSSDSQGKFTLASWQVVNAPREVHLFSTGEEVDEAAYYNSVTSYDFANKGEFSFYVQERCAGAQKEVEAYGDRAAWSEVKDSGKESERKVFTNAPSNATYVLLKGHFSGKSYVTDENGKKSDAPVTVDADVQYYILLGENSGNDYNSYITNRNTQYTYIVRVKGVNEITVEVNTKSENRPDAEGDVVIFDGGQPVPFDSHYGTAVLEFTKAQIETAKKLKSFGYAVNTPYGSIAYREDDTETAEQKRYSNWVKFVKKTTSSDGKYYPYPYTKASKDNKKIMTVKEFLDDLKKNTSYDSNNKVRYTVYVDENYYEKNPKTNDVASWKEFVNTDDRKLLILANTKISSDGRSSVTSAAYVLRQKAILTIYNKDASGLNRAWGLESIEENLTEGSKTMPKGTNITSGQDEKYGRKNTLSTVYYPNNENAWTTLIDDRGYLTFKIDKKAQNMIYACMQRNRDLNGDGKITADEVRWYVPSLYQYQQMYIGMYGINDQAARLYFNEAIGDNRKWEYKHYISSYNQQILWAEEGLSNGSKNDSFDSKFYVRCVRDLGVDVSETDRDNIKWDDENQYQNIFTKSDETIELTYLNRASVRESLESKEIDGHCTTFSENNRPAIKFTYNKSLTEKVKFKDENTKAEDGRSTVCGKTFGNSWRIPTLTEVNIMMQATSSETIKGDAEILLTRTKFEFWEWNDQETKDNIPTNSLVTKWNSKGQDRYSGRYAHVYKSLFYLANGFSYNWTRDGHGKLYNDGTNDQNIQGKIRCVRDGN